MSSSYVRRWLLIAPANKQDNPQRYGDDDPIFPNGVTVGATIKFKTFRGDETVVTSTRFVTGGDNNHLAIADYTGKPDGIIKIIHSTRECFCCSEGYADPLHEGDNCTGTVEFDDLEYINNRGMNFGELLAFEVINP